MFSEKNVVNVLGGPSVLGRRINNPLEMDQIIRDGFPYKAGNHVRSLLSLKLPVFAKIKVRISKPVVFPSNERMWEKKLRRTVKAK